MSDQPQSLQSNLPKSSPIPEPSLTPQEQPQQSVEPTATAEVSDVAQAPAAPVPPKRVLSEDDFPRPTIKPADAYVEVRFRIYTVDGIAHEDTQGFNLARALVAAHQQITNMNFHSFLKTVEQVMENDLCNFLTDTVEPHKVEIEEVRNATKQAIANHVASKSGRDGQFGPR